MHEAGHVGTGDELGAVLDVILDAVSAHGHGDVGLEDGEGAAKAAAFIRPTELDQLQALDHAQELLRLGKGGAHALAAFSQTEAAQSVTALVQADAVRKTDGQALDLGDIDEELAELIHPVREGIMAGFQAFFEVQHAATGRRDDALTTGKGGGEVGDAAFPEAGVA